MILDVARARYRGPYRDDPCVINHEEGDTRVALILDGAGSWGSGMEAAAWVRETIAKTLLIETPHSADGIAAAVERAAQILPDPFRNSDWGSDFAVAGILAEGQRCSVFTSGGFAALHVRNGASLPFLMPRRWVDPQIEVGNLAPAEADLHPLRGIYLGPFVSPGEKIRFQSTDIVPEDGIRACLIARDRLVRHLLPRNPAEWEHMNAERLAEMQTEIGEPWSPVVLCRFS